MKKNKLIYSQSRYKTKDEMPWHKSLRDEKLNLIYSEFNHYYEEITLHV